jgi:hypothetical protein
MAISSCLQILALIMLSSKNKLGALSIFAVTCALITGAITVFGAEKVVAFATAMSFIATTVAALAAWGYLRETAEVVKATRNSALQQARVASIMEADLRFRIAPNLRFRPLAGSIADRPVEIENVGRGVAVNTIGKVTYLGTKREQSLQLENWLEPNKPVQIRISQSPQEPGFTAKMVCTDSAGLNRYRFAHDQNGLTTAEVMPISGTGVQ